MALSFTGILVDEVVNEDNSVSSLAGTVEVIIGCPRVTDKDVV